MKKYFIIAVFLAFICFVFCHDKNTNEPLPDNTHPQVDIPWPSLADSPWAMYHHDPQSTGRSPYHGPTNGMIKWTFKPDGAIHSAIALDEESNIYFAVCFEKPDLSTSLYSVSSAGDVNADGSVNVTDVIWLLNNMMPPTYSCNDAADCNDDGSINMTDAVFALQHLTPPTFPEPNLECGPDPTPG